MRTPPPTPPLRVTSLDDGAVWRVTLAGGRGNVIDRARTEALLALAVEAGADARLKAVVVDGDGGTFSFGASVPEHLPGEVEQMLPRFHAMLLAWMEASVVLVAAVRGRCLGGGLELAAACHRVIAHPDAALGQPEIVLGVVAPFASAFLAERIGRPAAEDLCLTGRTVSGREAERLRLVDDLADDPEEAALTWARTHLLPRSASSLRIAARALRGGLVERLRPALAAQERLYLDVLMATKDAHEGLRAFLEKRAPVWSGR